MPDEHTQWERVSRRPAETGSFRARLRTRDPRRRRPRRGPNPHRDEATYDRLVLKWVCIVVILLAIITVLAWQIWSP